MFQSITYEEETDSTSIEFADDCSGLVSAKDEETLQTAVNVMMDQYERYFSASGLALNLKKSNDPLQRYAGLRRPDAIRRSTI